MKIPTFVLIEFCHVLIFYKPYKLDDDWTIIRPSFMMNKIWNKTLTYIRKEVNLRVPMTQQSTIRSYKKGNQMYIHKLTAFYEALFTARSQHMHQYVRTCETQTCFLHLFRAFYIIS